MDRVKYFLCPILAQKVGEMDHGPLFLLVYKVMAEQMDIPTLLHDEEDNASDIDEPCEPIPDPRDEDEDGEESYDISRIIWQENPLGGRTLARNIMDTPEGLTPYSSGVTSRLDALQLFLTEDILNIILKHTNERFEKEGKEKTNPTEFMAFLGLIIAMGVTKQNKVNIKNLWEPESLYHMPIFTATMPRVRFNTLLWGIRFDDKDTRNERLETDRLAALREVTEILKNNCNMAYVPGPNVTVDERITPFRGRCRFRVYMKNKPNKYGIKSWVLCDSLNFYVKNFEIYLGKKDNQRDVKQGLNVVKRLTTVLEKGRNVTCDNFFTSMELAHEMAKQNLTVLGTVRMNRKEIPDALKPDKNRPLYSSKFLFSKDATMVSYVHKVNKAVVLLSSEHTKREVRGPEDDYKPEIIMAYNQRKIGVDLLDSKTKDYTVQRTTCRWTLALFMNYLDIMLHNAYIIWSKIYEQEEEREDFYKSLIEDMIHDEIQRRINIGFIGIHENVQKSIRTAAKVLNLEIQAASTYQHEAVGHKSSEPSRCYMCEKRNRTRAKCSKCSNYVCQLHSVRMRLVICKNCKESIVEHAE